MTRQRKGARACTAATRGSTRGSTRAARVHTQGRPTAARATASPAGVEGPSRAAERAWIPRHRARAIQARQHPTGRPRAHPGPKTDRGPTAS
jgi:hypothetical protein